MDPPWAYGRTSRSVKLSGYSDTHYAPLTTDQLCELPIGALASDNAVMLLWATWPFLFEAKKCLDAWGFEFVTGLPWVKVDSKQQPAYGVGYWIRGATEPLLLAKRPGAPSIRTNFVGLLSPTLGHSRKPRDAHELAECFPGPRLELFARQLVSGWTCVGDECPSTAGEDIRVSLDCLLDTDPGGRLGPAPMAQTAPSGSLLI